MRSSCRYQIKLGAQSLHRRIHYLPARWWYYQSGRQSHENYVARCTSIGNYFYPRIRRIYNDMQSMYRATSQMISEYGVPTMSSMTSRVAEKLYWRLRQSSKADGIFDLEFRTRSRELKTNDLNLKAQSRHSNFINRICNSCCKQRTMSCARPAK